MSSSANHIIEKVFLDVHTRSEKKAYQIKDNISLFLEEEVFPAIEKLFDKYDKHGQTIRFDRLDVDFSVEDWNKRETIKFELLKNVEQQIKNIEQQINSVDQQITEKKSDVSTNSVFTNSKIRNKVEPEISEKQIVETQQNYYSTFLFFLENGYLPWFGREEYIVELTAQNYWEERLKQATFQSALQNLFTNNKAATERFILQFSDEMILAFIQSVETLQIKNKTELLSFVKKLLPEFRNSFLKLLVQLSIKSTESKTQFIYFIQQQLYKENVAELTEEFNIDWIKELLFSIQRCFADKSNTKYFQLSNIEIKQVTKEIKTFIAGTPLAGESEEPVKANLENKPTIISQDFFRSEKEKEPPFFEKDKTEIVVRNAGLVLFHPFLKSFFNHFDWLEENGKIRPEQLSTAIQALHFMAIGKENFFEGNMMFEKFLCGAPLNMPISRISYLTKEIKEECNVLLKEVIRNWPALKNTSPDGLRQMFVFRNGKLIEKDKGYKLIVERKVQDVLVEKLPWNISLVKFPWKDELLFVQW